MNPVKKLAAIHDLSGIGRTSLTSLIPIFSTMGIQVCPFPTAVLSSNTSFFKDFTFVDLTSTMVDYMEHWKQIDMDFDCIYSGFLGSSKQVDILLDFINHYKTENNLVVVDPVMGDRGILYPTIDENLVEKMKELVRVSDIITPNFTEAKILIGREYTEEISLGKIKKLLRLLADMGPRIVVITSVPNLEESSLSVYAYDRENEDYWRVDCEYIDAEFPGTGDSFTSVLVASLLNGDSLPIAMDKSVQFILLAIKESYGFKYNKGEGILLEKVLGSLKLPIAESKYRKI